MDYVEMDNEQRRQFIDVQQAYASALSHRKARDCA